MSETLTLLLALVAGGALGVFFFFGLWWTVQKGVASKHPALWFLGSMLTRTGIILTGFYYVSGGRWERLVACLAGFTIARFYVTLRLRSGPAPLTVTPVEQHSTPTPEGDRAT